MAKIFKMEVTKQLSDGSAITTTNDHMINETYVTRRADFLGQQEGTTVKTFQRDEAKAGSRWRVVPDLSSGTLS